MRPVNSSGEWKKRRARGFNRHRRLEDKLQSKRKALPSRQLKLLRRN